MVPEDQRTVPWSHVEEYVRHMERHGLKMPLPKKQDPFERWQPWEAPGIGLRLQGQQLARDEARSRARGATQAEDSDYRGGTRS